MKFRLDEANYCRKKIQNQVAEELTTEPL